MDNQPLCFVLMPFGKKPDPAGRGDIDFDAIYERAIRPGIEDAELVSVRADHEQTGGVIHKAMYERLLLCEFAVADLTTANANVFYELGVRHATRSHTTLPIFASHQRIPFDVNFVRALPYQLGPRNELTDALAAALREGLTKRLRVLRATAADHGVADSPLLQLLSGYTPPEISRLKTDEFRDRVDYARGLKAKLAKARRAEGLGELDAVRDGLGSLDAIETGVLVDLYLSYRGKKAWSHVIELYDRMPAPVRHTVLVREQLAFALNRRAGDDPYSPDRDEALSILEEVEQEQGPSSETCGLIGRIHKDRFRIAKKGGAVEEATGHLENAIEAYVRGFEADWRDAYPGINAVTLLELRGSAEALARKKRLLPVVRFAVEQRMAKSKPDYWDHATLLELAVLDHDEAEARRHLGRALAAVRERWEPESTGKNLGMIREAWDERGLAGELPWLDDVIEALTARSERSS